MAERGSYGLAPRLDIQQILAEARSRWLRPAEICEILRNYQKFHIASEPPNRPPSGSLFLFDRKVLRYFRKDGHNWRKKKDGKTVKEAHEKLKVGSVDVLHCYYAHGEENETFQRRSYWMLEQDLMHIVFVHYLEVKGNRTNIGGIRERDEVASDFQKDSPLSSSFPTNHKGAPSGSTDSPSPTNSVTSLCEDADSEDSYQASSRSRFLESPSMENGPLTDRMDAGGASSYFVHPSADNYSLSLIGANYISDVQKDGPRDSDGVTHATGSEDAIDLASWEEVLENSRGFHTSVTSRASSEPQSTLTDIFLGQENMTIGDNLDGESVLKEEFQNTVPRQPNWQISFGDNSVHLSTWPMNQLSNFELANDLGTALFEPGTLDMNAISAPEPFSTHPVQQNEQRVQHHLQTQLTNAESQFSIKSNSQTDMLFEGTNGNYALTLRKPLLDGEEALKKVDSFSRWVTRELGDVDDLHLQSSSGLSWSTVECGNVVDDSSLSPSLSQDQLFSILDFSPKWAYTDSETEVLITGTFLKSLPEVTKCNWSCMFGEVEVPAEVLANGILCCHTPPHTVGQVPFYITCSNRVACSEVREFDYRVGSIKDIDIAVIYSGAANEMHLHLRLERLLSLSSVIPPSHVVESVTVKQELISKIITLKEEEEYNQTLEPILQRDLSQHEVKEYLLKLLLKEKLYSWLLRKVCEDGKGPSILDDDGQGVIHLAAALGYDWAIKPIVTAEVSINFRDINGWTALHWAASCGREQTVAFLVSLGAAPGALTDPSPEFPLGKTPADLASGKGHKGISGFIAESSLTSYLKSLTMNDQKEDGMPEVSGTKGVLTISERTATPVNYVDAADALSLKDSLNAVCNATQAADRIHQMFRMHSFERRQITQHDDGGGSLSDECALSLVSAKTRKPGQSDRLVHAAATHIQKKYRGWKKRKEFLTIRQRIVKIQAHVRGHQVRKQYRTIVWSVGILEKVILRWRRKGIGLRGFRPDVHKDPKPQVVPSTEDDYDFLKEGRKQTEERLQRIHECKLPPLPEFSERKPTRSLGVLLTNTAASSKLPMARVPSKHGRDQALDFQGFLNDLQDWELSFKDKDKKMKPQAPQKDKSVSSSRSTGKIPKFDYSRSNAGEFDYKNYGVNQISSGLITEESFPDATSEKELGNEHFKQKKFKEAIECYSRSIALSPTAVAYANRAMAYLKIRRFQEAENDCTEALNLDDRYIKAYSRRATARKELGKYKECFEDAEFALRLEPQNQEVKKQYTEARSLYDKAILQKVSGPLRGSMQGMQKVGSSESKVNGHNIHPVLNNIQGSEVATVQDHAKENDGLVPARASASVEEIESKHVKAGSRVGQQEVDGSRVDAIQSSRVDSVKKNQRTGTQELKTSVQELASQAASRAMAEAAKNITKPNSAYQFEVSWRGLSGDRALQARLLKAVSPTTLPQIFKNALSAYLLMDIIKCVATFFTEEMDLAVKYVENLTKVSRFNLLVMCLSSSDRDDLHKIWDEVFCSKATPIEYAEMLDNLRSKYHLKQ